MDGRTIENKGKTELAFFWVTKGDIRIGLQTVSGFPVYPSLHVQIGLWLFTRQFACWPHTFDVHGFTHFWFVHALSREHSDDTTHSGRQAGAVPTNSGKHVQIATPLLSLHWLFGPHELGRHASMGSFSTAGKINRILYEEGHSIINEREKGVDKETYRSQELRNNNDTSRRCIRYGKRTLASDLPLDILRFVDTFPDMGQRIYFECMLDLRHNQCSVYILVYSLRMDCRSSLANIGMNQRRFARDIQHLHCMDSAHMD